MTQLVEQALAEVRKLPDTDQNAIATFILEEIADERRWDDAFAGSQVRSLGWRRRCARTSAPGASTDYGKATRLDATRFRNEPRPVSFIAPREFCSSRKEACLNDASIGVAYENSHAAAYASCV
jgi:hypothetical protein